MKPFYPWRNMRHAGIILVIVLMAVGCASDAPPVTKLLEMQAEQSGGSHGSGAGEFIVKPMDTIEVRVWKEPEFSGQHFVRRDGKITMPLLGDVEVAGLSTVQVAEKVRGLLKTYIEFPEVMVAMSTARPPRVYVTGEVGHPGDVEIQDGTRFVQVITKVGGFTEWAKKSKILLIRIIGGKEMRFLVDYDAIISGKDPKQNVILREGDIIVVQ